MRHLKTLLTCLMALALHSPAWAEIYETTDAEGNPEFTDSPPAENAEVIDLQQTNIIDAPQAEPQEESQPQGQEQVENQGPTQQNNTVIVNDGGVDGEEYDGYYRRERGLDEVDPAAPREVLDGEAPRQVGDYNGQAPREVGDFGGEVPRGGEGNIEEHSLEGERASNRTGGAHLR
jgi:hypothetical protein